MKLLFKILFNLNHNYFIKNEDEYKNYESNYEFNILPDYLLTELYNELNNNNIKKKDKYINIKICLGIFITFYFSYELIKYFR